MAIRKEEVFERRQHRRFKVKSGAVVALIQCSLGDKYICWCKIINISKNGLAFAYIDRKGESNKQFELDILFSKDIANFTYLYKVPFTTVWVSHHPKSEQRGLQFGEMTSRQIFQLDTFIQEYTIGELRGHP